MNNVLKIKSRAPAIACAILVAMLGGCGGGGGGDNTSTATQTPTGDNTPAPFVPVLPSPDPVINASIVSSVPTPTYALASEELAAFSMLNSERGRCGFGLMAQSTELDMAARGHADWLLLNDYTGHYQAAGTPGFTGVAPVDRDVSAGYGALGSFAYSEVQSDDGGAKTGRGATSVRGLLNAPYHMLGMIRGYRDVGVSVRDKSDVNLSPNNRNTLNIDFAHKNVVGPQLAAAGSVRTYPCEGSTGLNRLLTEETPNPAPGRDLRLNPLGTSIGVVVDIGKTLIITSASMIKVASGTAVAMRAPVTGSNDPNAINGVSYFNANEGFVSADAPLEANTQYQVSITGTSSGTAFSRTFVFTTGS